MSYEGEKFLLKLYRELYNEQSVRHSGTKSDDKYKLINKYLKRLEKTEKVFDGEHEELEQYMKNRYYDKYVIKESDIPESYWELKDRISFERGQGHINYTEKMKHEEALTIIENQERSLDKWLDYLMKEDTSYPMWARYWAFQGMLRLGKYDKRRGNFSRRSKGTVAPFVELNAEALAHTIRTVETYCEGKDIDDSDLEQLVQSGNFGKLYSYNIWKVYEEEKNNEDNLNKNDGIWKEFTKGQEKDLVKLLDDKGTGWCIVEEATAKDYLNKGHLHIYFTKDKKGNYAIPRVCIRQEGNQIAEVRGIEKDQNLESEMNDITDKKLDEFEDKKEYKKKVSDMKKLTELYNKSKLNQELTYDDYKFLYEVDDDIEGFGWVSDPRIGQLRRKYVITDKKMVADFLGEHAYNTLKYASDDIKNDKEFIFEMVKRDYNLFEFVSGRFLYDRELFAKLKDDKNFMLGAIIYLYWPLDSASERLKNDKEFMLEIIERYPFELKYISENLRNDKDIVLKAVKQHGEVLEYASEEFRNDKEVVLAAVRQNGDALEYASERLQNDKEVVLEAVKQHGEALRYASIGLQANFELLSVAVEQEMPGYFVSKDDDKMVITRSKEL